MGQSEAPFDHTALPGPPHHLGVDDRDDRGMATISGALLIAYVRIGGVPVEHLLTAVVMTAPACIMLAKVMVPETGEPETLGRIPASAEQGGVNLIDAAARGTSEGLYLALNVGAMLSHSSP